MKITLAGGDLRSLTAGSLLAKEGYECRGAGFENYKEKADIPFCSCDSGFVKDSDVLILPLPCLDKDGKTVFAPFSKEKIGLSSLLPSLKKGCFVCGGMMPFEKENFKDYYSLEDMKIKNALLTAEGAAAIAITEMKITLFGSKTLVLGYGRIGKCLAKILKSLGSDVCAAARKSEDRAMAEISGMRAADFGSLKEELYKSDAIFNTVPARILSEEELMCIRSGVPLIELASGAGCADSEEAEKCFVRLIKAPSLPGRFSPVTAGRIIFESVMTLLKERGLAP